MDYKKNIIIVVVIISTIWFMSIVVIPSIYWHFLSKCSMCSVQTTFDFIKRTG